MRLIRLMVLGGGLWMALASFTLCLSVSGCSESSTPTQSSMGPTDQDEKIRQQMIEFEKSKHTKKKKR